MNLPIFFSLISLSLIIISADSSCHKSFKCGNLTIEFPFTHIDDPGCGLIMVDGCDAEQPVIFPGYGSTFNYTVLDTTSPNKLTIHDPWIRYQLEIKHCSSLPNVSLFKSPSISFTFSGSKLTVFTCYNQTHDDKIDSSFHGYSRKQCEFAGVYYKTERSDVPTARESNTTWCSMIQLPINPGQDNGDLFDLLVPEFTVEWRVTEDCRECYRRGGQCLTSGGNEFLCKEENIRIRRILLIGAVTLAALTSTAIIMIIVIRRKYTPQLRLFGFQKAKPGNEKDIGLFLKNYGNLAPIRYTYSEIKKMANSFRENLGKGGYGTVYKGKLQNGRPVAVKVLNESKENGEEFMNEVASISRTSHINIVNLLGFCFEGSKRALIYEFMPNGSLEKFIQNTVSSSSEEEGLGWQVLMEIALGIARGLEYLHHSCNMRILHFDIKPHNILLDQDFNPKISDFGLAKLCPNRSNRSSIVSMMVARGTIGYIAPEVFCRNFGEVSHKSDVYSFGMMVLEITGGRKDIDRADVDHTSEIYFPHYIYKQLEVNAERDGIFDGTVNEEESLAERKLSTVGLWCIQTDPRDRPSMTKVVEMLEGKLESLQVPPKPYLSSPPRAAPTFSSSESV